MSDNEQQMKEMAELINRLTRLVLELKERIEFLELTGKSSSRDIKPSPFGTIVYGVGG